MSFRICSVVCFFLITMVMPREALAQGSSALEGSWELIPERSTDIDLFANLAVEIRQNSSGVMVINTWGVGRAFRDSLVLKSGGVVNRVAVTNRVFATNVFMGLSMPIGTTREITAQWQSGGTVLKLEEAYTVRGSQGKTPVACVHTYQLSDDGLLTYTIKRTSRTTGPAVRFMLKRSGSLHAFFMKIEDNWEIGGRLPLQAFLLSLQGAANMDGPELYFVYPPDWPFTYTQSVFDFYKDKRSYTFHELKTPEEALQTLRKHVKGYVVWDKSARTSLIVSFTVAGLEKAVVVSEEMIPMVEKAGLKAIADFRGKFVGKSDAEIYGWAYDQYWSRCNKELIIWLGGEHGTLMKPAVADWGIYNHVFFNDLSSRETDTLEYTLARKILGEMKPASLVMGWHSYGKDRERDHVKLTSSFGHRVEGLHTLPNMSFSCQIPASRGFVFTNNHHVVSGKQYIPAKKVYISCIQTDGIGLGAWLKPGRGDIPYAWEVTMNWVWMAPSMLEYFYGMATPNDYFIGCLSGAGYMYPKAVPPQLLPGAIAKARDLMGKLDLKIFEIMDYSEGATVEGNTDLTKEVVDAYYRGMPDVLGFVNGYAPSYTFTVRDGKPLISYDYYLSPERPEADAVADLHELAAINAKRPYFLLMHVRESSDIKRVKGILDKLGSDFEVVPLDMFLVMAGKQPTFEERFREK